MSKETKTLISLYLKAVNRHGLNIRPRETVGTWEKCLQEYNGKTYLYYNTPDHSTHIVKG